MSFESLHLVPELLRAVADQGYTEPTPIQAKAIPLILERRDIMGCAQTGTGKTAGFTLPMLHVLAPDANTSTSPARHPVLALVLVPTRELAAQVEESVRTYGKYLPLRITVIYGGVDMKPQTKALQAGVEIVVATPGRLLDHLKQKTINLSQVKILVLDEADRMLDMGFLPDIRSILATLPPFRQNLLFSATFSEDIKRLANQIMRNPQMIEVARRNAPAELVTHQVYEISGANKHALLAHLIRSRNMTQVLVFTRMKRDADRLARQLQKDGLAAAAIHSDRSQSERMQALDEFKQGKMPILVATDIAARGLDIDQLPYVINYELPHVPEDYVHRIGRTGRAGTPGEAISLVSPEEREFLVNIEKLLKREIPRLEAPELGVRRERPARAATTEVSEESPEERRQRRGIRDAKASGHRRAGQSADAVGHATSSAHGQFDFSQPYESKSPPPAEAAVAAVSAGPPKPAARKVGALLGGRAKAKQES
jgi:ATP-dependent RNA helicase RhlE